MPCRLFIPRDALEAVPSVRELVLHVEEAQARSWQVMLRSLIGCLAQYFSSLACSVVQVQNHIGQSIHIELVVLLGKFDTPTADCALELEREIALVEEVELKQTSVVLSARCGYGLSGRVLDDYTRIIGQHLITILHVVIIATGGRRIDQARVYASSTAQEGQAAMNTCVRPDDTGDTQRHILDTAHIVARVFAVEHPFGDVDLAATGGFEAQELAREMETQGEVLHQFILAHVFVKVSFLHLTQREL